MRRSRHRDLHGRVAALRVGDCLVEPGLPSAHRHALQSALSLFMRRHHPDRVVRCLFFGPRLFVVRLA